MSIISDYTEQDIPFLKDQIIQTKYLLSKMGDHPLMYMPYALRLKELEDKLISLQVIAPNEILRR